MAEQPLTDISFDAMNTLLGTSYTSRRDLCNDSGIKKYSFYRSRPIELDGSLNVVLSTAPTTDRKLGDFRRYNHTPLTPKAANDYTQNWGPGGLTMTVSLNTFIERLNIKELIPSTTMYFTIKFYLSSANRSAETNVKRTYTVLLTLASETPLTGHTNNQTQAPASSTQLVVDTAVPTDNGLVSPDDIWYCDTYISDISGNALLRFDDGYTEVNTHEVANPITSKAWGNWTPVPSGYTFVAVAVTDSSSNNSGVDFAETIDTTYGLFYWFVYGLKGSNYFRLGDAVVTAVLRIAGNTDTALLTAAALNTAGVSSNQSDSGTLANSETWAFDDEGDVVLTAVDWTGFSEYDMGTSAP